VKHEDKVLVKMQRPLCMDGFTDETEYQGHLIKYEEEKECIFISMDTQTIENLSLDALYECEIHTEKNVIKCTGVIQERYCGTYGKTIKLIVKNGFYKINIK
jgi:hypothetical protein